MTAPRDLADFTVIARRSYDAARGRPSSFNTSRRLAKRESEHFLTAAATLAYGLVDGQPFRLAARAAGLNRADAKRSLEQIALQLAELQQSLLASHTPLDVTHAMAWAFALKERGGRAARLNAHGPRSIWTHVWMNQPSSLVVAWLPGPSDFAALPKPTDAPLTMSTILRAMASTDLKAAIERANPIARLSQWLSTLEPGSWKKIRAHWIATSLFVSADNFCAHRSIEPTPAIQAGWASHAWGPQDLASEWVPPARGISA